MLDALKPYWSNIASFIAGLAGGSLLTFTLVRNKVARGGSIVDQSGSRVGRDQVGGNNNSGNRR